MALEDGAAAVEFALVAVPLFLLVFGIIDFGFGFHAWDGTSNAAREGARLGAVQPDVAAIESRVRTTASFLNQSKLTVVITCARGAGAFGSCPSSSSWQEGDIVRVRVTYLYDYMTPLPGMVGLGSSLNEVSVAEARFEGQ